MYQAGDGNRRSVVRVRAHGTQFVYAKNFLTVTSSTATPFNLVDLYVGSSTGQATCVLADRPTVFPAGIWPFSDFIAWQRLDTSGTRREGVAASLPDCAPSLFSDNLRGVFPAGDRAFLFLDDADPNADEATLRYALATGGGLVTAFSPIQTRTASIVASLLPALSAVMYTVEAGTTADGLYIDTTLPPGTP